jgi:hypothetical protein
MKNLLIILLLGMSTVSFAVDHSVHFMHQGWSPAEEGALTGWWDFSDETTISKTGNYIDTITDKSASGFDLSEQLRGSHAGIESGTTVYNGRNVGYWPTAGDGTDEVCLKADNQDISETTIRVFVVAEITDHDHENSPLFSFNGGGTDFRFDTSSATTWRPSIDMSDGSTDLEPGEAHAGPSIFMMALTDDGNGMRIRIDGADIEDSTGYTDDIDKTSVDIRIFGQQGGQYNPAGWVGEVIMIDEEGADKRQRIEGYLAHKWGLTANLEPDHPYKTTAP